MINMINEPIVPSSGDLSSSVDYHESLRLMLDGMIDYAHYDPESKLSRFLKGTLLMRK
jgi:hypothetical protein